MKRGSTSRVSTRYVDYTPKAKSTAGRNITGEKKALMGGFSSRLFCLQEEWSGVHPPLEDHQKAPVMLPRKA